VNAHTVDLCTRNTFFSRILDHKRLSFELVEFEFNSKARDKLRNIKCENGDSMPQFSRSSPNAGMSWEMWG